VNFLIIKLHFAFVFLYIFIALSFKNLCIWCICAQRETWKRHPILFRGPIRIPVHQRT